MNFNVEFINGEPSRDWEKKNCQILGEIFE